MAKRLQYKPIYIQDECFGGDEAESIVVIVKLEAQGKNRMYYKNDVLNFNNRQLLSEYITKNKVKVLPEEKFKVPIGIKAHHLCEACKAKI